MRQQHQAMVAWQQGPHLRGDVAPVGRADAMAAMATRRDAPAGAPEPPTSSSPHAPGPPRAGDSPWGRPRHTKGGQGLPWPPHAPAEWSLALAIRAGGDGGLGGSCPHTPVPVCSLPRQMPDYKRATLQDDEGPEPAGDGSTSPDSVEVRSAPAPPSFPSPSSLAPLLALSQSLPADGWAAGAGPAAKPVLAVPRDVLGGSQNAAESVPGPSSFLAAGGGTSTRCHLAGAVPRPPP